MDSGAFRTRWGVVPARAPQLHPQLLACSLSVEETRNEQLSRNYDFVSHMVLPAIEARTSYLNQRSSGIWDWAAGAFRWVCFCAASSCHVLLPVTSAALGFLCAGFPPLSLDFCCSRFLLCELSLNWAGWDREHCVKKCNCLSGRDWEPVYKC